MKYHWNAYYDFTLHSLIIKNGNTWQHYSNIVKSRQYWTIDISRPSIDNTPPQQISSILPVDVIK